MKLLENVLLERDGVTVMPQILKAIRFADTRHRALTGQELTVTSVLDGTHSPHSRHYIGGAFDMRIWAFTTGQKEKFLESIRPILGDHYDVVSEPSHIHIEFDPER